MFDAILLRTLLKINEPNSPEIAARMTFIIPPIYERIKLIVQNLTSTFKSVGLSLFNGELNMN